jgi:hypothetical protein
LGDPRGGHGGHILLDAVLNGGQMGVHLGVSLLYVYRMYVQDVISQISCEWRD